ncbi:MAG: DUF1559 domain-containing protein [Planctomycetaceae bacterium]
MSTLFSFRKRARKGFTLIELLVVIAIIAILIALLLPAVQMARAAARRTQNRNNLKQIGLALHNYHEVYKMFPSGWIGVTAGGPDVEGGSGFGWAAMILPYVDQGNLYDRLDFKLPITHATNQPAALTYLPVFRSPSDIGPTDWKIEDETTPGNFLMTLATASYVGNFGTQDLEDCHSLPPATACTSNGIFFHNSKTGIADILDGTSNTFIVGERKTDVDQEWFSTWAGAVPQGEEHLARILGVADHTPNHPATHFDDFSSHDAGGVHFVFGDGHVKFLSETIDLAVFQGLATRAGGEYVEGDF